MVIKFYRPRGSVIFWQNSERQFWDTWRLSRPARKKISARTSPCAVESVSYKSEFPIERINVANTGREQFDAALDIVLVTRLDGLVDVPSGDRYRSSD